MSGREHVLETVRRSNPVPRLDTMPESDLAELDSLLDQRRSLMTDLKNVSRTVDQPSPMRRRAMRPALAFVTMLVVVLAAVGAAVVLSTGDDAPIGPAATTAAPPTTAPPTTATVDPTQPSSTESPGTAVATTAPISSAPPFLDGQWKRVEVGADMTVNDLVATDWGLFAAAFEGLWRSTNGETWSQVEFDGPLADMVVGVVDYGGGINVYGFAESTTLLWRSEDGENWARSALFDETLSPQGTARSAHGLLVYGWLDSPSGTHLLLSEDGVNHVSIGAEESGLAGVFLQSVNPTSDGLLALAMTQDGFLLYRSDNGTSWEPVPGSDFPPGASPGSIMQHDRFTYAVGAVEGPITPDGGPQIAMWRAAPGGTWQPIELPSLPGNSWIGSMIATEYGLLAVGGHETFDPHETNLVVLTTLDGLVFEPVPDPEDVFRGGGTQAPPAVLGDQVVIFNGADAWTWSPAI